MLVIFYVQCMLIIVLLYSMLNTSISTSYTVQNANSIITDIIFYHAIDFVLIAQGYCYITTTSICIYSDSTNKHSEYYANFTFTWATLMTAK